MDEFHIPVTDYSGEKTQTKRYGYWPENHPRTPRWGRIDTWIILCTVPGAIGPFTAERTVTFSEWHVDPEDYIHG